MQHLINHLIIHGLPIQANSVVRLTFTSIVDAFSLSEERGERGTKERNLLQRCTLKFLFFNGIEVLHFD